MIEVHLYGRLRRYRPPTGVGEPCVICVEPDRRQRTVGDIVLDLGLPATEVADVYCDGLLDYDGLGALLTGVMRLGLFPPEMALGRALHSAGLIDTRPTPPVSLPALVEGLTSFARPPSSAEPQYDPDRFVEQHRADLEFVRALVAKGRLSD